MTVTNAENNISSADRWHYKLRSLNQLPDMVEPWTRAAEQGDVRGKGGGTGKSVGGTGTGARPMKPRARTGCSNVEHGLCNGIGVRWFNYKGTGGESRDAGVRSEDCSEKPELLAVEQRVSDGETVA